MKASAISLDLTNPTPRSAIVVLFLLVNAVAIAFLNSPGTSDMEIWNNWMHEISSSGLVDGYKNSDTDYPPLAFLILAGVLKLSVVLGATQFAVLKCSFFAFLLATAACFYWFTRNSVLTAALEFALILNSMALGYLDIYMAPFFLAGLFFLQRGSLSLGLVLFTVSCFTKWQPLIVAPFVFAYVLAKSRGSIGDQTLRLRQQFTPFVLAAAIITCPLFLIFGSKILDSLHRAMTYHIFLSAYGLNLSWIHTWILHLVDSQKYGRLDNGMIDIFQTRDLSVIWPEKFLFYVTYAVIFMSFLRQKKTFDQLIVYSILGYLAYFNFNTSVHENHLFLVCCLAWVLVFIEPSQLVRGINFSIAANANLFLFYGVFGQRINPVLGGLDITLVFAVANLVLFAGFLVHTFRRDSIRWKFWQSNPAD